MEPKAHELVLYSRIARGTSVDVITFDLPAILPTSTVVFNTTCDVGFITAIVDLSAT